MIEFGAKVSIEYVARRILYVASYGPVVELRHEVYCNFLLPDVVVGVGAFFTIKCVFGFHASMQVEVHDGSGIECEMLAEVL